MKTKSALWWSCVIPSFAHVLSQINALATITTHKRERDYVENKTWRKWTSKCVKFNFSLDTQIKLFIQINPPSHFAGSNFFKICGTDLRGFYLDQIQWIVIKSVIECSMCSKCSKCSKCSICSKCPRLPTKNKATDNRAINQSIKQANKVTSSLLELLVTAKKSFF